MALISVDGCITKDVQGFSPLAAGTVYGYGLFETILITGKAPVFLNEHLERLSNSARFLNLAVPSLADIKCWLPALINTQEIVTGRMRILLTAIDSGIGASEITTKLIITAENGLPYCDQQYQQGVRVGLLNFTKNQNSLLVKHKTSNYLENILGQQQARKNGWLEGLLLNNVGFLAEGTKSNIFFSQDRQLVTPDTASGILPGITRAKIMAIAKAAGWSVQEKKVTTAEIFAAEQCFICNSLMGIMPVIAINDHPVGKGCPGEETIFLRRKYQALTLGGG